MLSRMKTYIFRGVLAVVPIVLTVLAVQFVYVVIDKRILNVFDDYIGVRIPGLGVILMLAVFFFIGLIASHVLGKRFFALIENITEKIPLINTTYKVGRQIAETLSLPEKQVFKKAVLVEYFRPGVWTIGFVTGSIVDKNQLQKKYLKVFIPTVPNPTSGFLIILEESQTIDPGWSVEEAVKSVISGGIIGPGEISFERK